jgi:hypothetical protein
MHTRRLSSIVHEGEGKGFRRGVGGGKAHAARHAPHPDAPRCGAAAAHSHTVSPPHYLPSAQSADFHF